VHCGRQLATAEARLVGPDGTLYAHASTACLVFDMPSPTGNKP
jgi:acyl-coenzyme A thioesterase PaaI-like protein